MPRTWWKRVRGFGQGVILGTARHATNKLGDVVERFAISQISEDVSGMRHVVLKGHPIGLDLFIRQAAQPDRLFVGRHP